MRSAIVASLIVLTTSGIQGQDLQQAEAALAKAVDFYSNQVSQEGGYLWRYSADLRLGEGEGKGKRTTAWVQPPGSPSVGLAYLEAYQRTGKPYLLTAAREAGMGLVRGQLRSGGWDYRIEYAAADRKRYAYRVDPAGGKRNVSTLDDNTTQSAMQFLMQLDAELSFRDEQIHEAVEYGLKRLLAVQYPNGAWPQRFADSQPTPDPAKASFPDSWSRKYPGKSYSAFYTFNDNTISDMILTMLLAWEIYDQQRYLEAAKHAGDFILLAQMPEPQPAWAQQYDQQMHPAWARKFEPPAVTGGESQGIMRTLILLYHQTGEKKYLDAVAPALKYLKASEVSPGKLARFYELRTNRPLYFTRQYELTYEPNDLPTHYGFIVGSRLDRLERDYNDALKQRQPRQLYQKAKAGRRTSALVRQAQEIISAMDSSGAWPESGELGSHDYQGKILNSRTFIQRLETLSRLVGSQ